MLAAKSKETWSQTFLVQEFHTKIDIYILDMLFHFTYCQIGLAIYFLLLLCGLVGGILIPIYD